MTTEDLKQNNVGRKVLIDAIGPFENCRATLRGWAKNQQKVLVSLDSAYGKGLQPGRILEVTIGSVNFAKGPKVSEDGKQWVPVSSQR
jgi:hypothetical protein